MRQAIRGLLSRPITQPALLKLLKLCHAGLNYGGGQSVESSGEVGALRFLAGAHRRSGPFTLFDVGANDGEYLAVALRVLGDMRKIYSFEPQTASFEKLRARFGNLSGVELRKAAVGSEVGTADLFFNSEDETAASLHRNSNLGQTHLEKVQLTTIDQICSDAGIVRIDLLKIDTEGYEMEVLHGASSLIERGGISAIQFEFGETFLQTPYHFLDLWNLLSARYRVYRILKHGLIEVLRYSPDLEVYKIANFLCRMKTAS